MWLKRSLSLISFLIIWQILSFNYPTGIVPGLGEIGNALYNIALEDEFMINIKDSFVRVLIGTFISLIIGTALGIIGGISRTVREYMYPIMVMMESIPPMAWIVVVIIWFSIGDIPPIVAAITSATPIVFFNIVEGVKNIDDRYIEMADIFSFNFYEKLIYIYVPGIVPVIIAALSSNFSLNWRVVIMAEALSSYSGLGQSLWGSYLYGDTQQVFAYIAVIAVLGLVVEYLLLEPVKKYTTKRFNLAKEQGR